MDQISNEDIVQPTAEKKKRKPRTKNTTNKNQEAPKDKKPRQPRVNKEKVNKIMKAIKTAKTGEKVSKSASLSDPPPLSYFGESSTKISISCPDMQMFEEISTDGLQQDNPDYNQNASISGIQSYTSICQETSENRVNQEIDQEATIQFMDVNQEIPSSVGQSTPNFYQSQDEVTENKNSEVNQALTEELGTEFLNFNQGFPISLGSSPKSNHSPEKENEKSTTQDVSQRNFEATDGTIKFTEQQATSSIIKNQLLTTKFTEQLTKQVEEKRDEDEIVGQGAPITATMSSCSSSSSSSCQSCEKTKSKNSSSDENGIEISPRHMYNDGIIELHTESPFITEDDNSQAEEINFQEKHLKLVTHKNISEVVKAVKRIHQNEINAEKENQKRKKREAQHFFDNLIDLANEGKTILNL